MNVFAVFDTFGQILPKAVIWEDGRKFVIDRVLRVEQRSSLRCGGAGLRYHVLICGHERYLYLEQTRWFIEPVN